MTDLLPANRPWLDGVTYVDHDRDAHRLDGQPVIGVTSALQLAGKSADFTKANPEALERARQVGTATHVAAHYYDENDLQFETVADLIKARVDAWRSFREQYSLLPVQRETIVVSRKHGYIGRFDRLFLAGDTRHTIVDLKTGDPKAAAANLQLALYEIALHEELDFYAWFHPELMTGALESLLAATHPAHGTCERWSVRLLKTGNYKLTTYPESPRTPAQDRAEALKAVADARVLRGLPERPERAA